MASCKVLGDLALLMMFKLYQAKLRQSRILLPSARRGMFIALRSHEAIAHPGFRKNVSGMRRVRLDLLSQICDENPQMLDLIAGVRSPHRAEQFSMRNRFAGL